MTVIVRVCVLVLLVSAALCSDGVADSPRGACYCRAAGTLQCTADLAERECKRRCDDAFCDDWFWKERLPCWNWGYGG